MVFDDWVMIMVMVMVRTMIVMMIVNFLFLGSSPPANGRPILHAHTTHGVSGSSELQDGSQRGRGQREQGPHHAVGEGRVQGPLQQVSGTVLFLAFTICGSVIFRGRCLVNLDLKY